MDLLDEVAEKFADVLDYGLMSSPEHNKVSAQLNEFCENKLTEEQADELNDMIGKLSSAIFHSSVKSGMKLGAKLTAELLRR